MVDLFAKCMQYTTMRDAMAAGTYPFFLAMDSQEGPVANYRGRSIIMCGSNNYLGLTTDPRVRQAAMSALRDGGPSCTGSRLVNGNLKLHEELERELAEFFGKEAALVFSAGYLANVGAISSLLDRND